MAQWSQAAMDKRIADKNAAILAERADLFKRFRDGGWTIRVLDPTVERQWVEQKDSWFLAGQGAHFYVKMPGAYPMRIKTVEQLQRLVTGVA
jgi:hypothetical protein